MSIWSNTTSGNDLKPLSESEIKKIYEHGHKIEEEQLAYESKVIEHIKTLKKIGDWTDNDFMLWGLIQGHMVRGVPVSPAIGRFINDWMKSHIDRPRTEVEEGT